MFASYTFHVSCHNATVGKERKPGSFQLCLRIRFSWTMKCTRAVTPSKNLGTVPVYKEIIPARIVFFCKSLTTWEANNNNIAEFTLLFIYLRYHYL